MNLRRRFAASSALIFSLVLLGQSFAFAVGDSYADGVKAYGRGDFNGASRLLDQAVKKTPGDVNALYYDALAYHQLKNWKVATERYQTILKRFPSSTAAARAREALTALTPSAVSTPTSTSATTLPTRSSAIAPATAGSHQPEGSSEEDAAIKALLGATGASNEPPADLASLPEQASFYYQKADSGHMQVDLQIEGHPVKAFFDTGATAFFYKDQLKQSGIDVSKAVPGGFTHGWAGVPVPLLVMPVNVKLGNMTRRLTIRMQDTTSDLGHNLIGQDFVRGFQYEIDDKASRVDLRKKIQRGQQTHDALYDIPCTRRGKDDYIQVEINGQKVDAFIDTGASSTIIDESTASRLHLEPSGETQRMSGVGGGLTVALAYANIRIGPIRKDGFQVRIGGTMGCCIGQDLMSGWRCKVDRENNLLHFFH